MFYFNSVGVEHVPEEIKEFVGNKNIIANIFRVQASDLVMYWYFSVGFIDFTNLFSPYDFDKNDHTILTYLKAE